MSMFFKYMSQIPFCFNFTYDTFEMSKWVMVDLIKHFFMAYAFSDMNKSVLIIPSS